MSFAHFLTGLLFVCFLLSNFESSLYTPDPRPVSDLQIFLVCKYFLLIFSLSDLAAAAAGAQLDKLRGVSGLCDNHVGIREPEEDGNHHRDRPCWAQTISFKTVLFMVLVQEIGRAHV